MSVATKKKAVKKAATSAKSKTGKAIGFTNAILASANLATKTISRFNKICQLIKNENPGAEIISGYCSIGRMIVYKLSAERVVVEIIDKQVINGLLTTFADINNQATYDNGDDGIAFDHREPDRLVVDLDGFIGNREKIESHRATNDIYVWPVVKAIFGISFLDQKAKKLWEDERKFKFTSFNQLIAAGTILGVETANGIQVGKVKSIKYSPPGMFSSEMWQVHLEFFRRTLDGYQTSTLTHPVYYEPGELSLEKVGLHIVSEKMEMEMVARGKRYVDATEKPGYLQYDGVLIRKSWWSQSVYRAKGRIMCDITAMVSFDPDYRHYYGGEMRENSNQDEGKKTFLTPDEIRADKEKLMMLPPVIYGFSFLCKKWGEMRFDQTSSINFRDLAFDQLVIPDDKKTTILALVKQSKVMGQSDIIENKGGGCIFLLHGNPGVGKTLTAEAASEKLHRPLYMVGAGELGTSPEELEETLRKILDLVCSWDGILLIDEADIFLEERQEHDIVRNAMVGIFLRMLEYYQGILFLTTNRVQNIDEAFFSRIGLGLHYVDLDASTRETIWENLATLMEVNGLDYKALAEADLNGRQIKNCLRLAKAIAAETETEVTTESVNSIISMTSEFKSVLKRGK